MGPKPVVTGLSPKEGPPGTKVTIRGEFLGSRAEDLVGESYFDFQFCLYLEKYGKNGHPQKIHPQFTCSKQPKIEI